MNTAPTTNPDGSGWYEIRLHGRLDPRWSARFEGMTLTTGDGFTLLTGEDALTTYVGANNPSGEQFFCKHCGVRPFMRGNLPQLGGAYVGVALACLDGVPPEALLAGPVRVCDGRANAWMQTPSFVAHL